MLIEIRPAMLEDKSETVRLWMACDLVVSYNDPSADFVFAQSAENADILLGLDETGHVVGSVMVGQDGHRGWLYYVAAAPSSRMLGIGRAMVEAAEEWLEGRGITKVQLLVREQNGKVTAFYERLGFEVASRIVMSKRISKVH